VSRRLPGNPVVAVSGLAREARIAAGPGVRAIAVAGSARRLADALERELARGAAGVISFGIAGGLDEGIAAGTWIVARSVVAGDARWSCNREWGAALVARLPGAVFADIAGIDAPVLRAAAKRALHQATGAAAVDTESHVAAEAAARHGLPFAAFRVVADSARRGLPAVATTAVAHDGTIRHVAALGTIARNPVQIPAALRAAVDAARALRALSRGRRRLGAGLALANLDEPVLDLR